MTSSLQMSAMDRAMAEYGEEVDAVAKSLQARSTATAGARAANGSREHPTAYLENLTAVVSVPKGCLFVGHTNTDMDSVGGAVGAAELYGGRACLAQPPSELNGEIMYAIAYARSGEKPEWRSDDVAAWASLHQGDSIDGFGSSAANPTMSLAHFPKIFDPTSSRVIMVDHSAPSQMVPCLRQRVIDEGETSVLLGIIDHHALDEAIYTKAPLFMDVRPWGSMSTIVFHSFLRSARPIPADVARLMLCAIMSDTVNLTSPTTTLADRYIVPLLCRFCGEQQHNLLAQQLFKAKTAWFVTLSPFECVRADQKDFATVASDGSRYSWGWATVEVNEPTKLLEKSKQLLLELVQLKQDKHFEFAFLSVVDLTSKTSKILLCGAREVSLARAAFSNGVVGRAPLGEKHDDAEFKMLSTLGLNVENTIMDCGARTSRKKQFKPSVDSALQAGWLISDAAADSAAVGEGPKKLLRTVTNEGSGGLQGLQRAYSIDE